VACRRPASLGTMGRPALLQTLYGLKAYMRGTAL